MHTVMFSGMGKVETIIYVNGLKTIDLTFVPVIRCRRYELIPGM
jgi:hypothetical protein